jgi:ATP sulfurylase
LRDQKPYELTPSQTRLIFQHHNWYKVVGFYADNYLPNLIHEYQQFSTIENYDCDGLFIQTTFGSDNLNYFDNDSMLSVYQNLVESNYPANKTVIGGFKNYPRHAGLREVLFHALCHKNFGCSHFIINNNHESSDNFYTYLDTVKFIEELGDIGIQPIIFEDIYYCTSCKKLVEACEHDGKNSKKIRESDLHESLSLQKNIPSWFMRQSVIEYLYENK